MRSQIFLGSSKEGMKYLEAVSEYLEPVGDVVKWMSAFSLNKSALDSLIKKTKLSDFAILIATCDDVTLKREELTTTPRDNIIFEFGLFTGSTGIDGAFLLAEEKADLPSDLEGITVARFSNDDTKHNSLRRVCGKIAKHIESEQQVAKLGLLPSTALALGYYHSFVKGVCEHVRDAKLIMLEGSPIRVKDFKLHVIIPSELDDNGVIDFRQSYNSSLGLEQAQTVGRSADQRGFPFHFKMDPNDQDLEHPVEVNLYDIPTTLNTIVEAVKIFLPSEKVGSNSEREYLESRELKNFVKVLKYLVTKNRLTKKHVAILDEVTD